MERPSVTGILETCLYVSDVAASSEFYNRVFGFETLISEPRICVFAVAPGSVLILFKRGATLKAMPVGEGFIPAHDGGGEQHFAFAIPNDAYENWKTYLAGLDIELESEVHWPKGGRSLYFRDPDRLVVELATPGLWKNYQD